MDFRFGSTKIIFKAAVRCLHARQCVCLGQHGMGTVCVRVHSVCLSRDVPRVHLPGKQRRDAGKIIDKCRDPVEDRIRN